MNTALAWSDAVSVVALGIPALLALVAFWAPLRAGLASGAALGLAILFAVGTAVAPGGPAKGGASLGVRQDAATVVMLLLIAALAVIIVRYSRTYLDRDPGLARLLRWMLLTLSAVTALVVANNLLVMAVSWTGASLALHRLLTFASDRRAAIVAAHKKFLVSRLADVFLAVCLGLVYANVGSLDLDRVVAWVGARDDSGPSMEVAAVLLVVAVALRSAQLPFHGWLTQVMEAPTPVSALLHAGVVNIGGFVLIRLAPWLGEAELARLLLLGIGLVSTVVAALVMTTRVSVKVGLAWSTCAQIGFMLVQCGLGLWPLALLHLVAHSLYKAHAFLRAGSTVEEWRALALARPSPAPSFWRLAAATIVSLGSAALCVAAWLRFGPATSSIEPATWVLALIVGVSMIPLLPQRRGAPLGIVGAAGRVAGILLLYALWHEVAGRLLPSQAGGTSSALGLALVGVGFAGLFVARAVIQLRPEGTFARAVYPWLFAGLWLDERFTRLAFRVWPPRPRQSSSFPQRAVRIPQIFEARA